MEQAGLSGEHVCKRPSGCAAPDRAADSLPHRAPRTGGRATADQRRRRLEVWGSFIDHELVARGMRPAQLARYANVNASTVSTWRHKKSLPNAEAVLGVARCFQLPIGLVAERAGMLPPPLEQSPSRIVGDPEWRAVLAAIDRLPEAQFRRLKAVLGRVVRGELDDAS